jgi:hypothetical protein
MANLEHHLVIGKHDINKHQSLDLIKLKPSQKERLKAMDMQISQLNSQKEVYLLSVLEWHEVGKKMYELTSDYDLKEVIKKD